MRLHSHVWFPRILFRLKLAAESRKPLRWLSPRCKDHLTWHRRPFSLQTAATHGRPLPRCRKACNRHGMRFISSFSASRRFAGRTVCNSRTDSVSAFSASAFPSARASPVRIYLWILPIDSAAGLDRWFVISASTLSFLPDQCRRRRSHPRARCLHGCESCNWSDLLRTPRSSSLAYYRCSAS